MSNINAKNSYVSSKIKLYYKNKHKEKSIKNTLIKKHINNRKKGGFYKIYQNIIARINIIYKINKIQFTNTYLEIIGCTFEQLEKYITGKLKDKMTFDNYGEWEIDHIIPVSSFDFTVRDNIWKCFHYNNLQPLWFKENREKFNKINYLSEQDVLSEAEQGRSNVKCL